MQFLRAGHIFSLTDMSEQKTIDVAATIGGASLAGVASGKAALALLFAALPADGATVLLDFRSISLITASAFREAIFPIIDWSIKDNRPCLLVNVNTVTTEEALIAAESSGLVLVFASLDDKGLHSPVSRGTLEEKHAIALRIVLELGESDAKAVKERSGEGTVTTAWNNRLVALHKMGLLRERKVGKTKFYSAVVRGMSYGS